MLGGAALMELNVSQLGWLLGIIGVVFGIWGQVRGGKQASDQAAREIATILTKLDFMSRQMEVMQSQIGTFNGCIIDLATRLGAVEMSTTRAHVRIDKLEVDEP